MFDPPLPSWTHTQSIQFRSARYAPLRSTEWIGYGIYRSNVTLQGQCEIDDLYVALNTTGKQFVVPVEAKSYGNHLNKKQIVQMIDFASARYSKLILRPVGVQEMKDGSLVFVEFTPADHPNDVKIRDSRRYKLVPMAEVPTDKQQNEP